MSKITFRADEDLVERLETLDTSKSEVMREALRAYLDDAERSDTNRPATKRVGTSVGEALTARIDDLIAERLDELFEHSTRRASDVNVNVTLDGVTSDDATVGRKTKSDGTRKTASREPREPSSETSTEPSTSHAIACEQCGESMERDHVYCPNCGEKASRRVFCECGDELRSDWAFCPGCGRRTPAADVLDSR